MSPRKNLWYGAVAMAGVLLLASQSYRTADAAATAAREKAIVSAQQAFDTVCWHDETSARFGCGEFVRSARVKSVSVTVTFTDGQTRTLVSGPKTDAMFLSKQAAEKFLARYYRDTRQDAKLKALTARLKTATER